MRFKDAGGLSMDIPDPDPLEAMTAELVEVSGDITGDPYKVIMLRDLPAGQQVILRLPCQQYSMLDAQAEGCRAEDVLAEVVKRINGY